MRILYIDIDSLRADHLGCYGYKRNTSPNIDKIAEQGIRFDNCFASDTPCLPSRSSFFSGRFGIHSGVVTHGGTNADPYVLGPVRNFCANKEYLHFPKILADSAKLHTVSVSSFATRHAAWWYYQGFKEMYDSGKGGNDTVGDVLPLIEDWLERKGDSDDWFMHAHFWDPHTNYRTPKEYGNPFENEPLSDDWVSEELLEKQKDGTHHDPNVMKRYCGKEDGEIDLKDYKKFVDGYDTSIKYVDDAIGKIFAILKEKGVLDETIVIISTDHGENFGEENIYGDHTMASYSVSRIPFVMHWPGLTDKKVFDSKFYQTDLAASILEFIGCEVPEMWDGKSFAEDIKAGKETGRDYIVSSHCAWSCTRSVFFDNYIMTKVYDSGEKNYPEYMVFNTETDKHGLNDLQKSNPELLHKGQALLDNWQTEMLRSSQNPDPLWETMQEGGPWHLRAIKKQKKKL